MLTMCGTGVLRASVVLLGMLAGLGAVGVADTFQVSGALQGSNGGTGTLSGTVSIDFANNTVLGEDLRVSGFNLTNVSSDQSPGNGGPGDYLAGFKVWEFLAGYFPVSQNQLVYDLSVYAPSSSTTNPMGGPLCSLEYDCGFGGITRIVRGPGAIATLVSGTITPVAATPEPGSLWLLATGAAGALAGARRRLRR